MDLKKLSIEEKIGQRFIIGVNSDNIDLLVDLIKNNYIGGVVLYRKNYDSYKKMLSVINRLKRANSKNKIPLFISIDQEGGKVNRMPPEFVNIRNVYDVSRIDKTLIYETANITGEILSSVGINMDFAPVMDLYDNNSKALYKRCFFGDVDDVCNSSMDYVKGLQDNGIISVPKHFPGHGISNIDSHFLTPYVSNYKKVLNRHILPFENAIKNDIDAIMVSHLVIRKLTGGLPASISNKFIHKYIRDKFNFNGVIITDEINMLSRNPLYKFIYVKKAISSGSDIILVKANDNVLKFIQKYQKLISDNKDYIKSLDESVERILKLKEKYNINDKPSQAKCDIDKINERINKINEICS